MVGERRDMREGEGGGDRGDMAVDVKGLMDQFRSTTEKHKQAGGGEDGGGEGGGHGSTMVANGAPLLMVRGLRPST